MFNSISNINLRIIIICIFNYWWNYARDLTNIKTFRLVLISPTKSKPCALKTQHIFAKFVALIYELFTGLALGLQANISQLNNCPKIDSPFFCQIYIYIYIEKDICILLHRLEAKAHKKPFFYVSCTSAVVCVTLARGIQGQGSGRRLRCPVTRPTLWQQRKPKKKATKGNPADPRSRRRRRGRRQTEFVVVVAVAIGKAFFNCFRFEVMTNAFPLFSQPFAPWCSPFSGLHAAIVPFSDSLILFFSRSHAAGWPRCCFFISCADFRSKQATGGNELWPPGPLPPAPSAPPPPATATAHPGTHHLCTIAVRIINRNLKIFDIK